MILETIFYNVDNFCKNLTNPSGCSSISGCRSTKSIKCNSRIPLSDIMTILIYFHHSGYRTFKKYYKNCGDLKGAFKYLPSYNRFVEIMKQALIPLNMFMNALSKNKCTGIGFIDSTKIQVCHNLRIGSNKVFKKTAKRGKTSTGWFYGFKLHLVINDSGEIVSFMLTPGNVADNNATLVKKLVKNCFGKLFGDRGYISKTLFKDLFEKGLKLITRLKSKMKNKLIDLHEKFLLHKRGIIESTNALLKETCQIEHSRHRSPVNFVVNLVSGLVAYCFLLKKPTLSGHFRSNLIGCF